ncbi:MAG TPA: hypothetical protein VFA50_15905 [Stellaceae bacterium]|nr:hypothetical protein [Stellaceae bacterium]
MTQSNYPLRLQASLLEEVRRLAAKEGASVNQFINVAVAEKLSALRTAAFFRERSQRADVNEALALLDRLGTEPPRLGDEISGGPDDDAGLRLAEPERTRKGVRRGRRSVTG